MLKLLVTGAAGYLGSILTKKLVHSGYIVTALDNFHYRQNTLLDLCSEINFNIVRGDARDKELVKKLLKDADVIIPLAALVGMPACKKNPQLAQEVNCDAVKFIVDNKSSDQRVLFPNTNSGYGLGQGLSYCTEETELKPVSIYGKTKIDAEKAVLDAGNSLVFRLATVFGASPKMRLDLMVNDFVYRAWWDHFMVLFESHYKRNFVYIGDVANAFIWGIENFDRVKNQVYNFGLSDANLTKLELCQLIQKHVGDFHIDLSEIRKDPDQRNYIVSNDKIEKAGFKATTSVDFGIYELLKSFEIINPQVYSNL